MLTAITFTKIECTRKYIRVTGIWEHPALNHFDTVMRIDSDSCFKEENDYLPNFHHEGLLYHSQYVGVEGKRFYNYALNLYCG